MGREIFVNSLVLREEYPQIEEFRSVKSTGKLHCLGHGDRRTPSYPFLSHRGLSLLCHCRFFLVFENSTFGHGNQCLSLLVGRGNLVSTLICVDERPWGKSRDDEGSRGWLCRTPITTPILRYVCRSKITKSSSDHIFNVKLMILSEVILKLVVGWKIGSKKVKTIL